MMKAFEKEPTPIIKKPVEIKTEEKTVKMVKTRDQVGTSGPTELDVLPHHVQQHIAAGWNIKG